MKRMRKESARRPELPDELWLHIFHKVYKAYAHHRAPLFCLPCVSHQWNQVFGHYVRKYFEQIKTLYNRILIRFPETVKLRLDLFEQGTRSHPRDITGSTLLGLTNLTSLNVNRNITIPDDLTLQLATRLKSLSLRGDTLITPKALAQMTGLTKLSLRGMSVSGHALGQLTNLTVLNLSDMAGSVTDNNLRSLTALKSLAVTRNSWSITGHAFPHLTNMVALDLQRNDDITWPLAQLSSLTALNVSGHCGSIHDANLCQMTQLKCLWLASNHYVTSKALRNLTQLERLSLYETRDVDYTVLTCLTNLKQLSLRRGECKHCGDINLSPLNQLERLDIDDTHLLIEIFPHDTCPWRLPALKELVCSNDEAIKSIPRVTALLESRGVAVCVGTYYHCWKYNADAWLRGVDL